MEKIQHYNQWLEQQKTDLQRDVYRDTFTGIFNRKKHDVAIKSLIDEFHHNIKPFSMVVIDVDKFKTINEKYSYQIGDAVLKSVVDLIKFYTKNSYTFSRFGGAKLMILLPNTKLDRAVLFAEKIRGYIENMDQSFDGNYIDVTLSIGVDEFKFADDEETFFNRVKDYMHRSIDAGGNKVSYNILNG